jgi:hypothetical protein
MGTQPQQQTMSPAMGGLVSAAQTPGKGTAGAAAQIAAALMAKQRLQQWQQKFGVPSYGNPAAQPGQVTPGAGSPGVPAPGQLPLAAPQSGMPQQIPTAAQMPPQQIAT